MVDQNRLEVERIRNLVQGFGWVVSKDEITDDKIIMTMEKPRVVPVSGQMAGPG